MKNYILPTLLFFSLPVLAQQQMNFGRYKSRAIFTRATAACPAPLVVMETGSGPNGPEEVIPGSLTGDGQPHALFNEFAEGLQRARVGTLQIGKPGVEFRKPSDATPSFYDQKTYEDLTWQGLIDNVSDAVAFAKTLPCVDAKRIYLLGHSEGTQLAVDFAHQHPELKGLILVGYTGESLATTADWQFYRRSIDAFVATDVDVNHDQAVSVDEAKKWPEFHWPWQPGQTSVSFAEIEATLRAMPQLQAVFEKMKSSKLWQGVFSRPPIYKEAAELPQDIFIFTGAVDTQTRPEEALRARDACKAAKKKNCTVKIVEGLTHGMSQLKGPRKQKLLDATLGPVDESFKNLLKITAQKF